MELRIISLNVNSIVEHRRRVLLNDFITKNPAHIYCIQETKFGTKHDFFFTSYFGFGDAKGADVCMPLYETYPMRYECSDK